MEAAGSSKMMVTFYQAAQHHTAGENNLQVKLQSRVFSSLYFLMIGDRKINDSELNSSKHSPN
jgi:hypothetical protein